MSPNKEEKYTFITQLKLRIKKWIIRVLSFCETLPKSTITRVINFQLVKSATSTGANHRAACRARSKNEFFSKLSIAVEEADESHYWLEIIEAKGLICDPIELEYLLRESDEITKILASARANTRKS